MEALRFGVHPFRISCPDPPQAQTMPSAAVAPFVLLATATGAWFVAANLPGGSCRFTGRHCPRSPTNGLWGVMRPRQQPSNTRPLGRFDQLVELFGSRLHVVIPCLARQATTWRLGE